MSHNCVTVGLCDTIHLLRTRPKPTNVPQKEQLNLTDNRGIDVTSHSSADDELCKNSAANDFRAKLTNVSNSRRSRTHPPEENREGGNDVPCLPFFLAGWVRLHVGYVSKHH